jgi:uncharacterized protein (TIGR00725 family)
MTVQVAVIGPGDDARPVDVDRAFEVGQLLAERGAVVVTGGLGGVMAAALEGAAAAGGITLALLPGPDRTAVATVVVATGLGEARNVLVVRSADAVIAIGGSWGTLSEIALARRAGVPIVSVDGWSVLDADGAALYLHGVDTAAAAVTYALNPGRGTMEV